MLNLFVTPILTLMQAARLAEYSSGGS